MVPLGDVRGQYRPSLAGGLLVPRAYLEPPNHGSGAIIGSKRPVSGDSCQQNYKSGEAIVAIVESG